MRFSEHLLDCVDLEVALGQQELELLVFALKLAQAADILGLDAGIFALPKVERVRAHAVFAANLGLSRSTASRILQYPHNLLFCKFRLLHLSPRFWTGETHLKASSFPGGRPHTLGTVKAAQTLLLLARASLKNFVDDPFDPNPCSGITRSSTKCDLSGSYFSGIV